MLGIRCIFCTGVTLVHRHRWRLQRCSGAAEPRLCGLLRTATCGHRRLRRWLVQLGLRPHGRRRRPHGWRQRVFALLWPRRWHGALCELGHCSALSHNVRQQQLRTEHRRRQVQAGNQQLHPDCELQASVSRTCLPFGSRGHHDWRPHPCIPLRGWWIHGIFWGCLHPRLRPICQSCHHRHWLGP